MAVRIFQPVFNTFEEFLAELRKRGRIRLVRVDDQGLVEPTKKGNAFVLQPKVRVVATALDPNPNSREIIMLERKWETGSGNVSIDVFSGRGSYNDRTGEKTRDQIIEALEAQGYSVTKGEWTKESAESALAGIAI